MANSIVAAVANSTNNGGDVTLDLGSDLAENDIIVLGGGFAGGTATAPGALGPAGFSSVFVLDSADTDFKVEWLRAGSTPPTSILTAGSGNNQDATAYAVFAIRGADTSSNPFDTAAQTSIAVGVPNASSIITETDGAAVLVFAGNDVFDPTPGVVTNFAHDISASNNETDDFSIGAAASIFASAGTKNAGAWSSWGSGNYVAATLAVKPSASVITGQPSVVSGPVSEIAFTTATGEGSVLADGGSPILQRGVAWNTSGSPTTADSFANTPGTTGFFQSSITGLSQATSYFAAAFAINAEGSTYGADEAFSTNASIITGGASVLTGPTVEINTTTATGQGSVTSDGGSPILQRGVAWATTANPTTNDNFSNTPGTTGAFQSSITGLSAATSYFAAAFAINAEASVYGADDAFSTNPAVDAPDPFQSFVGILSRVPKGYRRAQY